MRLSYTPRQIGRGLTDIGPLHISNLKTQRGRGIGSLFAGLWKYLRPLAVSGLKTLAKQSIKSGGNILKEMADGNTDIKKILKNEGVQALENLTTKGIKKLKENVQAGDGSISRTGPIKRRILLTELPVVKSKRGRRMASKTIVKRKKNRRRVLIGRGHCGCKKSKRRNVQLGGRKRRKKAGRRRRKTKKTRSLDIFDY